MSEETPRLSRKEMRERGLLTAIPESGESPLSQTQELRLARLSRKEMRERERASAAAVAAEIEAVKAAKAEEAARRAKETATRTTNTPTPVAEDSLAARTRGSALPASTSIPSSPSAPSASEAAQASAAVDSGRKSIFERFSQPSQEEVEETGSLEDRLLARVQSETPSYKREHNAWEHETQLEKTERETKEGGPHSAPAEESKVSLQVPLPAPRVRNHELSAQSEANLPESSIFDEETEETELAPRREGMGGVLLTIIMILIGILLGFLIGWAINHFFLSAESVVPTMSATRATHLIS